MLLSALPLDVLPPQAVPLAADVVLMSLPRGSRDQARLTVERRLPFGTVEVQSSAGPFQLAAMRMPEGLRGAAPDETDDTSSSSYPPVLFGADIADLAADLEPASRVRLLAFLLGFCRKAFDLSDHPEFANTCQILARLTIPIAGSVEPIATITRGWMVLSGLPPATETAVWALSPNRVRRTSVLPLDGEPKTCITQRLSPGDLVLSLGQSPALWVVGSVREGFRDLLRPQPEAEALRAACLKALAPECPVVAAALREIAMISPEAPIRLDDMRRPIAGALEAAISDGEGKLFLRGWLHDPFGLVAAADVCGLTGSARIELSDLCRFHRPDLEHRMASAAFTSANSPVGFVAHLPDPTGGLSLQPTLVLRLHSGARLPLRAPLHVVRPAEARSAVLTSVPPSLVSDQMLQTCIGPAAAAFHRQALLDRGTPEIVQIGDRIADPHTSFIIPLYRNLSFLRFQISAFASDWSCRDVELIYVLDSPEQRAEVEHQLRGLNAMHATPITLVVMSRNLGYAAANNAGATIARAPTLLLLNSDIVPDQPNWLTPLQDAIAEPGVGAAGPKLLFDDESLQHAGLYFQRGPDGLWLNAHYHKGMPRQWPAANVRRDVPGLTGAAILVHRSLFESVGGICEDYIVGDYEDSDFCLRLRACGHRTVYVPAAELFHFERRSIGLHKGYVGTLACRYNRTLHHRRWDDFISGLSIELAGPTSQLSEVA